jgi:long-chain acyl-CoA synthetase
MKLIWLKHYEKGTPAKLVYPKVALNSFLEDSATRHPDHAATVYFGSQLSFARLNGLANRFATHLPSLGFKPGERVALMLPNCPQMLVAYFGILKARGIVVQINPLHPAAEVAHQIKDSGARILVTLPRFESATGPLLAQGLLDKLVLTEVGEFASPLYRVLIPLVARLHREAHGPVDGAGRVRFASLLQGGEAFDLQSSAKPGDLALIQYTGGTTGISKGAMLTHANLVANAVQCRAWISDLKGGPGGDVFLSVIPFFHVYGMTVCMNLGMLVGCTQVLLPRFEVKRVLAAGKKYRCTVFPGVGLMYNALNQAPGARESLSHIRACISGAGPLYREVQEKFEAITGGKVVEGYGLTEASPVTHCNPLQGARKTGFIGLPFPDTEAKVMDEDKGRREMRTGQVGELVIRGPQVMKGYWKRPKETKTALRGGWLYTGDLASVDKEGYFRIAERKKDMIKSRGENVYPRRVEEALLKCPGVKDVVVVGLPDKALGEKIKAYIVAGEPKPSEDGLRSFCRQHLGKVEVPQEFEFRSELPKNMIGKVLRRTLREEEARKEGKAGG